MLFEVQFFDEFEKVAVLTFSPRSELYLDVVLGAR